MAACPNTADDCAGSGEDGVFRLSATATGTSGPPSCLGTWIVTEVPPGIFRFTPPGGEGSLVPGTAEVCTVDFTYGTQRLPEFDVDPTPGVQTNNVVSATVQDPAGTLPATRRGGFDRTTVGQAIPGLTTVASQSGSTVPATTTAVATLTAPSPPGAPPTGSITFNLHSPFDFTCANPPVFSHTVPVHGSGSYPSGPVPIPAAGTYVWFVSYSGDPNYLPPSAFCGGPNQTVSFGVERAQPTLVTHATPSVVLGESATDTATLSAGFAPTGTLTFSAYGPNNATCSGPAMFTSTVPVAGNGNYTSAPFTVTAHGTYRWVVTYSGDVNNLPVMSPCNSPNETTVTIAVDPFFSTSATSRAPLGSPIMDAASFFGATNPTGTITFNVYGPTDPGCAAAPVFTSTMVVAGTWPVISESFIPTRTG
ncbi:MAG: hypothetical protein M3179_13915, partial [Actinomycetota bacterium]|nr:hypothetical protein [Actinomycetota bacterium]